MCAEAKVSKDAKIRIRYNHVPNGLSLVSPESSCFDELWRRIWDRSVQHRQIQAALHKEWAWIPKNIVRRHMLLIRPRYEAVDTAGEGRVCFRQIYFK